MPQRPVPIVGAAQEFTYNGAGITAMLDGSASIDPDGGGITAYLWTIIGQPEGSTAALDDATVVSPTLTADLQGDYLVHLQVTSPSGASASHLTVPPEGDPGLFGSLGTASCRVSHRTKNFGWRIPARYERAWQDRVAEIFGDLDALVPTTNQQLRCAAKVDGIHVGDVVRVQGASGDLPACIKAPATFGVNLTGLLGVVMSASSNITGATLQVLVQGLYSLTWAGPSVDDDLYVSDTATLSDSPGTVVRRIGRVAAVGAGVVTCMIDGLPFALPGEALETNNGVIRVSDNGIGEPKLGVGAFADMGLPGNAAVYASDQPDDGGTVIVTYLGADTTFEFDSGGGVTAGHVQVVIGATVADTLAALGAAIVLALPVLAVATVVTAPGGWLLRIFVADYAAIVAGNDVAVRTTATHVLARSFVAALAQSKQAVAAYSVGLAGFDVTMGAVQLVTDFLSVRSAVVQVIDSTGVIKAFDGSVTFLEFVVVAGVPHRVVMVGQGTVTPFVAGDQMNLICTGDAPL